VLTGQILFVLFSLKMFIPISIWRFTLSAVSPAVLVPSLFRLKRLGYGEEKGINTLLIAASSLDDAVSISAFGILLGVLFSNGMYTLYKYIFFTMLILQYIHHLTMTFGAVRYRCTKLVLFLF